MTVSPTLARSSAVTLWIRAHCSPCAPGGVSQRTCQSLWTDLTAPCAVAWLLTPVMAVSAIKPTASALSKNWLNRAGLHGPIVASDRRKSPHRRKIWRITPHEPFHEPTPSTMVAAACQEPVKGPIVAKWGSRLRRPDARPAPVEIGLGPGDLVHCDGAGIVV